MALSLKEPGIGWLFLSWKGRIARQSYFLACLLIIVLQVYILLETALAGTDNASDGTMAAFGFLLIGSWILSLVVSVALVVKRLHDIDLPGIIAFALLVPGLGTALMIILVFVPSVQRTNDHGPPPFPKSK